MTRMERIQKKLADWEKQISKATADAVKAISEAKAKAKGKPKKAEAEAAKDPVDQYADVFFSLADRCAKITGPIAKLAELLGADPKVVEAAIDKANDRLKKGHSCGDDGFPFKPGAVVTILENPNSHDYPLKKALVIVGKDHAVYLKKGKWELGNHLPGDAALYAPATEAQIAEVIENLDTFRGFMGSDD